MALSGRNKDIFSYQPTLELLLQMKAGKKTKNKKMKVTISHLAISKKTAFLSATRHNLCIAVT